MTTKTIDVQEVPQQLTALLDEVAAGIEVIVMDGTTPRARLVPILLNIRRRIPGLHAGSMSASADFDAPLPEDFWTGAV